MRLLPGIDPGKLPVLAALAAAGGLTLLLAGAVAIYAAVDAIGALLLAVFLVVSLGLAASGWLVHWRSAAAGSSPHPLVERRSPLRNAGQALLRRVVLSALCQMTRGGMTPGWMTPG